jgi:hypothetical protein
MRDFLVEIIETCRPVMPTTFIGSGDVETLIRAAAMSGAWLVDDQKEKAMKSHARRDLDRDARVRFASDDFVAGYALGGAIHSVWGNGRHPDDVPFDELVAETHRRLENVIPSLDVAAAFRGGSNRFAGGGVAGICEPGLLEEPSILAHAWRTLSEHTPLYGSSVWQHAVNEVGLHYHHADFIRQAADEMFSRYMSFAKSG